jgi:hypothetical protein
MKSDIVLRLTQPPVFAEPADSQRLRLVAQEAAATITRLTAERDAFLADVEDGLSWNSSAIQCLDRIRQICRDQRATLKDSVDPQQSA